MSPVTIEPSLDTRGLGISQACLRHRDPSYNSLVSESRQCTANSGESGSPCLALSVQPAAFIKAKHLVRATQKKKELAVEVQ